MNFIMDHLDLAYKDRNFHSKFLKKPETKCNILIFLFFSVLFILRCKEIEIKGIKKFSTLCCQLQRKFKDFVLTYKENLRTLLLATKKNLGLCILTYKGKKQTKTFLTLCCDHIRGPPRNSGRVHPKTSPHKTSTHIRSPHKTSTCITKFQLKPF